MNISLNPKSSGSLAFAGGVIRKLREDSGLSQAALCELMGGMDKSTLSRIESGTLPLSRQMVFRIAKAMGKRPEAILLQCLREEPEFRDHPDGKVATLFEDLIQIFSREPSAGVATISTSELPPQGTVSN